LNPAQVQQNLFYKNGAGGFIILLNGSGGTAAGFFVVCLLNTFIMTDNNCTVNSPTYPLIEQTIQHHYDTSQADITMASFAGVKIISAKVLQKRNTRFPETKEEPTLDMYFSLKGHSSAADSNKGLLSEINSLHHGVIYTPRFDGYYSISGKEAEGFCVEIDSSYMHRLMITDLDCLKRFWDRAFSGEAAELSEVPMALTWQQNQVIRDIQECPYSGHMKMMYYESKIMELFLMQAEQAERLAGGPALSLHPADKERLYAARDFVKEHMFEPLSLMQVARHCGLNDFKLKKGFKALFGTTVFGYLNELKMNYGRQLLLASACTVAEAGYILGYTDSYNFTKAFKKYFGYPPGKLKLKH
jgi:AraC-like DNA-binding protein